MFTSYFGVLWHRIRTSYWFTPALMSAFGIVLPYLTVHFDLDLRQGPLAQTISWLNFTDRDAAGQLLTAVIGSIINVISITFSLTMVVLTIVASQYGPQILRNFMEDSATKFVLGTFVSTFIYCLLSLRILGSLEAGAPVPFVTVGLALVLTIFSVGVLIFFIHHIAQCIQVDLIIKRLSEELLRAIDLQFPTRIGEAPEEKSAAPGDESRRRKEEYPYRGELKAELGGYIQSLSGEDLLAQAVKLDCRVEVAVRPGDFVVPGSVLAELGGAGEPDAGQLDSLGKLFQIGARRTPLQDLKYTIEKISEIALRALSPGINEPYVAIKCIDYLSLALSLLGTRRPPASERLDDAGLVRVVAAPLPFDTILRASFEPIVHYAASDDRVISAVIDALDRIAARNELREHTEVLDGFRRELARIVAARDWDADRKRQLLERCGADDGAQS